MPPINDQSSAATVRSELPVIRAFHVYTFFSSAELVYPAAKKKGVSVLDTQSLLDRKLAYLMLRFTLGLDIFMHGVVRLPHLSAFVDGKRAELGNKS